MLESIFDDNVISNNEDIEMLDISNTEPVIEQKEVIQPVIDQPKIEPIENIVQTVPKEKVKDNIFTIQIALIIAWIILTAVVYFVGYPLFEPFINV